MENYRIDVHEIDLSTAHNDSEYTVGEMDTLLVRSIADITSGLSLKFDGTSNKAISLKAGDTFNFKNSKYEKIYFSNTTASGQAVLVFSRNVEIRTLLRLTSDIISSTVRASVVTIAVTATPIPAAALTDRINLQLINASGVTIYLGGAGVTVAGVTQGVPLADGASISLTIAESVALYGIVAVGTANLNILEGA